jgi:hypothetical protein
VLLTGCPLERARQIADGTVRAVADHRFVWNDKIFSIGVSIGLVAVTVESPSIDDLLHVADSACYVETTQGGLVHVCSARDEADVRRRGDAATRASSGVITNLPGPNTPASAGAIHAMHTARSSTFFFMTVRRVKLNPAARAAAIIALAAGNHRHR